MMSWRCAAHYDRTATTSALCVSFTQIELSSKHGLASMSYEDAFTKTPIMWGDYMRPGE